MSTKSTLNLIMKATRRCNLRCAYCGDWRATAGHTMRFPVLARVIQSALRDYDDVHFTWHGGETTTLPIAFYKKAMLLQARFRRSGQTITNGIQTNGTLVDASWARFFRESRFHVGISIDGPAEIHDKTRPYAGGRPSFDHVVRGIEVLKGHDVPFGVLMVVDREVLELGAERIFEFFLEIGVSNYSCLAVKPVARPDGGSEPLRYTDPESMSEFLCRLYDRWLRHGDPDVRISVIEDVRSRLRGEEAKTCVMAGSCFGKYFSIEPDGDVKHCDCFGDEAPLGNIGTTSLADIARSGPVQRRIEQDERELQALQARCPEFPLTRGGCAHERSLVARYGADDSCPCGTYHGLIAHIRARMHEEEEMLASADSALAEAC
jgi:uncharacterized protein